LYLAFAGLVEGIAKISTPFMLFVRQYFFKAA
jgi:hypothetical protein